MISIETIGTLSVLCFVFLLGLIIGAELEKRAHLQPNIMPIESNK